MMYAIPGTDVAVRTEEGEEQEPLGNRFWFTKNITNKFIFVNDQSAVKLLKERNEKLEKEGERKTAELAATQERLKTTHERFVEEKAVKDKQERVIDEARNENATLRERNRKLEEQKARELLQLQLEQRRKQEELQKFQRLKEEEMQKLQRLKEEQMKKLQEENEKLKEKCLIL